VPALSDPTQHVVAPRRMSDNPQGMWMLDRTTASDVVFAKLPPDPVVGRRLDAFFKALQDTELYKHFQAIQDDLSVLLAKVMDPGDPQQAAKAAMVALVDILKNLVDLALKAAAAIWESLMDMVSAGLERIHTLLNAPLPTGPLNDL
jgi:hypothetical protein